MRFPLLLLLLPFVLRRTKRGYAWPPTAATAAAAAAAFPMEVVLLYAVFYSVGRRSESAAAGLMHGSPQRIPIGSIFDNDSVVHSAFRYEFEKYNNSTGTLLKLDRYEKMIEEKGHNDMVKAMCSTIHNGVFALFGSATRPAIQRTVNTFARRFQMPYVTVGAPSLDWNHTQYAFTLFMRPRYHRAVLDIVTYFKWSKVYYIYNTFDGLSRIEYMHSVLNREDLTIDIDVRRIQVERCHVALRQLDARDPTPSNKFVILDIFPLPALQSVLRQIQNVGMNRGNYHYILSGLEMEELDLEDFRHGGANVTGFRLLRPDSLRTREVDRDWQRLNLRNWKDVGQGRKIQLDAALTIDSLTTMAKGLNTMIDRDPNVLGAVFRRGQFYNNNERGIDCKSPNVSPWQYGQKVLENFRTVNFSGVSGEVAFDPRGHRRNYTFDILSQRVDSDPVKIGQWNPLTGLIIKKQPEVNLSEKELPANRTRIVTTIRSDPYIMLRKLKAEEKGLVLTGNDVYEGYCADLAKMVAELVQFDYEIRLVNDNKYGEKMPDGTWNGMVGELSKKEADIAIAPLTISSMRERVIDFSKPFMNLGISIMIKKPEKQKPGVFSFMSPLSYEIWMCIVFSYLAVSVVLFVVSRFSPNEWQIEDSSQGPAFVNDFTIMNSLWFSLGAFMRRGCEVCPRSLAGRIVGSAWWFFTLIIISSYTANLAAFLTIERMMTPIESADDLAKQTEIAYGTLDAGSTKDFFRTSKIQIYEKMWSTMLANPNVFVKTTEEGVQRVRGSKGKYAFLLESTMNDYANQRKPCNTMKVGDNLDSKGYGIATYIGSDLREKINVAVLQLLEKEQLQKLQKKWWYDKGECVVESDSKSSGSSQTSLSLSNVAGIFYILIGGLGLAMIVGSFEFLYKSRVETKRQTTRLLDKSRSESTQYCGNDSTDRENGGYTYNEPVTSDSVNADTGKSQTQV